MYFMEMIKELDRGKKMTRECKMPFYLMMIGGELVFKRDDTFAPIQPAYMSREDCLASDWREFQ